MCEDLQGERAQAQDIGLNPRAFAIYGLLERQRQPMQVRDATAAYRFGEATAGQPSSPPKETGAEAAAPDVAKRDLASRIDEAIAPFTAMVDWRQKDDEQRRMRMAIKGCLHRSGVDRPTIEALTAEIVDLARTRTEP